jgi:nucleoside phosphorylase
MSNPILTPFKGTQFSVVTGWGTGSAITGITNANPAVVSRTAHGLVDGDIVKHAGIVGMEELNDRICVVDMLTADTYALRDVDATNYGAYVSGGTVSKATLSPSCQVTGYQGPTGTTPSTTVDTNCGSAKTYGTPQHGTVTLAFAEADNAFDSAFKAAQKNVTQLALKTTLALGRGVRVDIGTVVSYDSSASANGNWTGGATIERDFARIDV